MEQDEEVHCGFLLFLPQDVSRFNKIVKKRNWQQKYCILFNASKHGIERLEIFDSKEEVSATSVPRIITLENCIKITHSSPNTITIFTKSLTQHVCALSETDCKEWVDALQSVAFKGIESTNPLSCAQDNDLYSSSGEGVFSVKLCPSEASTRCGLEAIRYVLVLTTTSIELRDISDVHLHAVWPYKYIRRYGYRQGKFTFEAGRKCDTGEGIFHLEHPNQHEIFKCLQVKMKAMKQMIGNESTNSPERNDLNFSSSVSLAPGSRSPLVATRPDQLNLSSLTSLAPLSVKYSTSSTVIQTSEAGPSIRSKPVVKPKPQKPPRKIGTRYQQAEPAGDENIDCTNPFGKYDLNNAKLGVGDTYDNIEVRREAWRTHGLDDINHTEFVTDLAEKGNFVKLISRSQENLDDTQDSSRIILLPRSPVVEPADRGYDTLQLHFGSTSKFEHTAYKNVETRPSTLISDSVKSKDTWNDYDEVENVTSVMQSARLADDSYLGYGVLRKPSTPGPQVPTAAQAAAMHNQVSIEEVEHDTCNGTEYAIVSRPKRV